MWRPGEPGAVHRAHARPRGLTMVNPGVIIADEGAINKETMDKMEGAGWLVIIKPAGKEVTIVR